MEDKDFIKIDDLYKGRPDKEERIPAGAWNNMQDLLNKAAATGGGTGGGRYGMYALLALLTVGMGAGAVTWQHTNLKANADVATNVEQGQDASNTYANHIDTKTLSHTFPQIDAQALNNASNEAKANTDKYINNNVTITATHSDNVAVESDWNRAQQTTTSATSHSNNPIAHNADNNRKAARKVNRLQQAVQDQDAKILGSIQQNVPAKQAQSLAAIVSNNDITTATNLALSNIDKSKFAPTKASDKVYDAVVTLPNDKTKFVLPKDSDDWKKAVEGNETVINRKVSYQDLGDGKFAQQIDTLSTKTFVRTRLESLSDNDKLKLVAFASSKPIAMPLSNSETNNVANAASNISAMTGKNANSNLALLSDYRVKSTSNRQSLVAHFYDMMSQYLDGQKPYYFGANIGGQAMFSSPIQTGFHIGVGGYYEFKERYTLGVELKYTHNTFANGGQVLDKFSTFKNQVYNNSVYTALEQKYVNDYTLQSSSYLELPITIRYQLSKLSLMGGLYANYMAGTKYSVLKNKLESEGTVSSNKAFVSGTGSVLENDFKARYGMGLSIGVAYDFSRKVSLDMRINQNLWSNMNGTSHLSESLYRATGVQVSLFYFIGKKDKVIYMMNQK